MLFLYGLLCMALTMIGWTVCHTSTQSLQAAETTALEAKSKKNATQKAYSKSGIMAKETPNESIGATKEEIPKKLGEFQKAVINWRQAKGQEIILGGLEHPWTKAIAPLLPEFTELTGIKVTPRFASETEYVKTLPDILGSNSPTPDVVMMWAIGKFAGTGWVEPLENYYTNPALTDLKWYDLNDIFNSARQFPVWNNITYGVSITAEAQTLFLRQDMMKARGLLPPETFDDLLSLALVLKSDDIAGIAMRGQPTGDAVAWSAAGFVFSCGGEIIDEHGQAVFNSPEAIKAVEMYAALLQQAGPQKVASYHWREALNDYLQGRSAIGGDTSNFITEIENPDQSVAAGKTLYWLFPHSDNRPSKPNMWHWMLGINSRSEHKKEAWLFIMWATSKPASIRIACNGSPSARISVWKDDRFRQTFGKQAADATLANLKNADGMIMSRAWFHPKGPEVLDLFATAVNKVILGNDAKTALTEAVQKANDIIGK